MSEPVIAAGLIRQVVIGGYTYDTCPVLWGSHGCDRPPGHPEPCVCLDRHPNPDDPDDPDPLDLDPICSIKPRHPHSHPAREHEGEP